MTVDATTTRRPDLSVPPELYVEVQQFYAWQMPLLEAREFESFLETLTEDSVLSHSPMGWRLEGREVILAEMRQRRGDPDKPRSEITSPRHARDRGIAYYDGLVYRYWFDKMLVEPEVDGQVRVRYQAMMSMTDDRGKVAFEPTTTVRDVLVRCSDGLLRTATRHITHDTPAWADNPHNPDR